jgi:hypothetical protein
MVTVSSPSLTSRRSFSLPFPSCGTSSCCGGQVDQRYTLRCHPAVNNSYEYDYTMQISTQRRRSQLLTLFGRCVVEYSGTGKECTVACP